MIKPGVGGNKLLQMHRTFSDEHCGGRKREGATDAGG
jgi:hypothetical protein